VWASLDAREAPSLPFEVVPRRLLAAVALLAAGSGCAVNHFACERRGGARWRELETEHFLLRTDHSGERARELALELERIRDAIGQVLLESPPGRQGPLVHVVVMRSPYEWELFAPPGTAGIFTHSAWGEPTIVLPGAIHGATSRVIAHELAHLLAAADLQRQPPWFREGIATYAETVAFEGLAGNVTFGAVARDRARSVVSGLRGGMKAVLLERTRLDVGQYGLAWILVHYLLSERPDAFGALEERFARGEDPEEAWRAVFPEWDPAAADGVGRLEDVLWSYVERPVKAYVYPRRGLTRIPPPRERWLKAAEVHDMRLALPWANLGRPVSRDRLIAEATEAIREGPGSPTATALLAGEPGADARKLAERATRARPGDARTWVLLASVLPGEEPAAREAALRRALAADPTSAFASSALARHLLETGRAAEAVPPARRAVELAPWSPAVLDTASSVLEAEGSCAAALSLQERALDNLGDGASPELRRPLAERRDRLLRECGGAPEASTAPASDRPP
jgi:tetratricopeptide (TPR) repeat protein